MDSEKDKKVKRIARFLELGGTMLAEHCKVCGAPRFRYQGAVICPVCDVQEEEETPEPVAKVQIPESRQYTEKKRPSFEDEKRVQARRQKSQLGLKTSEAAKEEEKPLDFEEEKLSEIPYEEEEARRTVPVFQAALPERTEKSVLERTEKPVETSRHFGAHGDRKLLENLLFKKMVSIAASLQDETDPRNIAEELELIEKGLGLIERLRQI